MTKAEKRTEVLAAVQTILRGERDSVLWMATVSCLLREYFGYLWVGFYRAREEMLHIGPYQGALACLHIPFGKGVCGICAVQRQTIIVPDVHDFPGHITCDNRARSEVVVPIIDSRGALRAVLDVDSERKAAFTQADATFLEAIAGMMVDLEWNLQN